MIYSLSGMSKKKLFERKDSRRCTGNSGPHSSFLLPETPQRCNMTGAGDSISPCKNQHTHFHPSVIVQIKYLRKQLYKVLEPYRAIKKRRLPYSSRLQYIVLRKDYFAAPSTFLRGLRSSTSSTIPYSCASLAVIQ